VKDLPVIIIDTREQTAWEFSPALFRAQRAALPAGDYSLLGLEWHCAIERKNLDDLVGTVIHDWPRFRRELRRLATFEHASVVVEATIQDVLAHRYKSETNPVSVIGRCHSIELDYGIPVHFWGHREEARTCAERWFLLARKRFDAEITAAEVTHAAGA
jgi:ERCC4-type nuclease